MVLKNSVLPPKRLPLVCTSFSVSQYIEMNCELALQLSDCPGTPVETKDEPLLNVYSFRLLISETSWEGSSCSNSELEVKCKSKGRKSGDESCCLLGGPFDGGQQSSVTWEYGKISWGFVCGEMVLPLTCVMEN